MRDEDFFIKDASIDKIVLLIIFIFIIRNEIFQFRDV